MFSSLMEFVACISILLVSAILSPVIFVIKIVASTVAYVVLLSSSVDDGEVEGPTDKEWADFSVKSAPSRKERKFFKKRYKAIKKAA